jgi:hypothetical protein
MNPFTLFSFSSRGWTQEQADLVGEVRLLREKLKTMTLQKEETFWCDTRSYNGQKHLFED